MTGKTEAERKLGRGPRLNPWGPEGVLAAHQEIMRDKRALIDRAQRAEEQLSQVIQALCELLDDADFRMLLDNEGIEQIPARIARRLQREQRQ